MSEHDTEFDIKFKNYIDNDFLRFTNEKIPKSDEDTTTDIFYDDSDLMNEDSAVAVTEFMTAENGLRYSINTPHCFIDMSEEMFLRISVGVMRARDKINQRKTDKFTERFTEKKI